MKTNPKLGSLFDGSGGFPLAGSLCGIEPVWAAEVEPYPIAVTRSRFPTMKHLGDISKVNGAEIESVDIITFGSPCQDLSVAGKRAGLKHEANGDDETTRSGLFMEAVRIIKEMRSATNGEYPAFALWENVPGAFSSNKGEDFRIVLEELIKIVEPSASMPPVPKNGWPYADSYIGDGWSLAYRVFDAQHWGVPQRRRRIHLILDLRGERAREVLFEREGVRGYFAQGRTPWQAAAADAQNCTGADGRAGEDVISGGFCPEQSAKTRGIGWEIEMAPTLRAGAVPGVAYSIRSGCEGGGKGALVQVDKSATLATNNDQYLFQPVKEQHLFENHSQDTRYKGPLSVSPMLPAQLGTGGNNTPFVVESDPVYCLQDNGIDRADNAGCNGKGWKEDTCYTLNTIDRPAVAYPCVFRQGGFADYVEGEVGTLRASGSDYGGGTENLLVEHPTVAYGIGNGQANQSFSKEQVGALNCMHDQQAVAYVDTTHADDVARPDRTVAPLQTQDYKGGKLVQIRYIVRRLTPTECARLQGFADRWGDIDEKDSFTPEEHSFWQEVRNTHAAINGKAVKEYTEQQMLTWYNHLHTDSAEYKMWGNGIALPPALYCLQGIADALEAANAE